jgi:tetratricopeptide (TPR) repeat protein
LAGDLKTGPKKDESPDNYNSRIQNQIASAINIALRATNVNPADSQNWTNRGLIYENLLTLVGGADQAAVNTYNESLARNPADPNTYLRIGNVYLSLADNIQRVINGKQSNINFAEARKQIDDNLIKAEESFKKAVSLYNNFGQALFNLAVVYDRQNKIPDAIKQFEKLRATNPRDPSMAFQIGLLYYRNNQKNDALTAWQQAVLLFPNYSNARWYLSLVYEERGDLDGALKQVEEIEKFNPDNELVRTRLVQLRSGKRIIPPDKVLDQQPLNQ